MNETAIIGLGSNLGDREQNIRRALGAMAGRIGEVVASSSLLENQALLHPENPEPQESFFNAVALVDTQLSAAEVLRELLAIEQELGRKRNEFDKPWPPRLIDLDLIAFGRDVIDSKELTLPHPALHQRDFVLVPLAEVWPSWEHPILKLSATELLAQFLANTNSNVSSSAKS